MLLTGSNMLCWIFTWAHGIDPPKPIFATALSPFYTKHGSQGNVMHIAQHNGNVCFHISTHLLTTYFPWARTMSWKVFSFFRQFTWWNESGLGTGYEPDDIYCTLLLMCKQPTKAVVESVGHPRWVDAISWAWLSGLESKAQPERAEPDSAIAWWK